MVDLAADLLRMIKELKHDPAMLDYIVLEHWHPSRSIDGRDAQGRRYLRVSAAVLDEVRYVKGAPAPITGIPVYKRADMPEGWPDAL
jgi:hypothetical protein